MDWTIPRKEHIGTRHQQQQTAASGENRNRSLGPRKRQRRHQTGTEVSKNHQGREAEMQMHPAAVCTSTIQRLGYLPPPAAQHKHARKTAPCTAVPCTSHTLERFQLRPQAAAAGERFVCPSPVHLTLPHHSAASARPSASKQASSRCPAKSGPAPSQQRASLGAEPEELPAASQFPPVA